MVILSVSWDVLGVLISAQLALVLSAASSMPSLIGVAISTVYLSRNQTDPRVKGSTFMTVMMWITAVAVCLVGGLGLSQHAFRLIPPAGPVRRAAPP